MLARTGPIVIREADLPSALGRVHEKFFAEVSGPLVLERFYKRLMRIEHGGGGKKAAPPETTNAENFYYQKQMQGKTPMVIVLRDGEEIHGVIEWYDKHCLKVNRERGPNLLIPKASIKYLYKESEGDGGGMTRGGSGNR